MLLEVKEKEVKEIGCEEIYSGYYNTYLVELNIEEKLKPYLCKIQMACEGTETTEITYVEGQENYLPQAPISGKYAIKIVFYEVIGEELKLRYSLPIFYKWIKQGSYDGEIGRSPKPEEIDEFNKILAQTNKVKQETELIGNKVEQDKKEVEQDRQEVAQNTQKVQEISNNIEKENIIPKIKDLEENKLNKSGYEADKYLATDSQGNVVTKTIEIKVNEDEYGNSVNLSIDTTTYLMTLQLINKKGVAISTSSIDLPLETMVVNARYDSATKELIIVLQNGTELKVPIASIVNGLVNETTFNNAVKNLQEQITNNNDELNQLVGELSDVKEQQGLLKTEQATQNKSIGTNTKRVKTLEKNIFDSGKVQGVNSFSVNNSALAEMQEVKMTIDKAQETTEGKQLFDVSTIKNRILDSTGNLVYNADWRASDYISVLSNENYTFSWKSDSAFFQFKVGLYDKNKQNIKVLNYSKAGIYNKTFNVENAEFIIVNYSTIVGGENANRREIQLEKGITATPYEHYTGGQASPNPNYPQEINKVTSNWEFTSTDKNQLYYNKSIDFLINGVRFYTKNGNLYANGTSNKEIFGGAYEFQSNLKFVMDTNQKTIQNNSKITTFIFKDNDGSLMYEIKPSEKVEIKLQETTNCFNSFYIPTNTSFKNEKINVTLYEKGITNTIDLKGNEVLPDDEIILKFNEDDGKYWEYLKKKETKYVINGTENWEERPNIQQCDRFVFNTKIIPKQRNKCYSNYFEVINNDTNKFIIPSLMLNVGYQIIVDFSEKGTTTLEQFKQRLSTHNIEIVYELEEPQLIPLAPIDMMNMTYNPITNAYTSIDNIKIEAKYYRDFINSMNNLETDVAQNKSDISKINTEQTEQNNKISNIELEQTKQNEDIIQNSKDTIGNTKRIKTLETNIFDSGVAEGTSINIQDSSLAEMQEVSMKIDKAQEITEGYNLANISKNSTFDVKANIPINLKANVKYQFIWKDYTLGSSGFIVIKLFDENGQSVKNIQINQEYQSNSIFSFDKEISSFDLYSNLDFANSKGVFSILNEFMIIDYNKYKGKPYEPYTGGQASPNPEYPQEINKVVNNWEFISTGKNLFDKSKTEKGYIDLKTGNVVVNNTDMTSDFIKVDGNKDIIRTTRNGIAQYNINKEFIVGDYTDKIKTQENCKYIRISVLNKVIDTEQLEIGTQKTPYKLYTSITNTINLKGNEFLPRR